MTINSNTGQFERSPEENNDNQIATMNGAFSIPATFGA
jgi:hypothetical protein